MLKMVRRGQKKRFCVFGCDDLGSPMHNFPHPVKNAGLFATWVSIVGDRLKEKDPLKILQNKKICDYHFRPDQKVACHRLIYEAVPCQNFEGVFLHSVLTEIEHNYCLTDTRTFTQIGENEGAQKSSELLHKENKIAQKEIGDGTSDELLGLRQKGMALPYNGCTIPLLSKNSRLNNLPSASKPEIQQLDVRLPEPGDPTEADTFVNDDSPLSPVPETDAAIKTEDTKEKNVFSWQKTDLIVTDDTEDPTPAPVPEKPIPREDVVTLSLFCEKPEPPPVPCKPAAAVVPEDVEYRCKVCGAIVDGFQFWCVSCGRGALCGACAAWRQHDTHYILRTPRGAPWDQTQAILAVLMQQLHKANLLTPYATDENVVKVEVKQEPEEPPTLPVPTPEPDPLGVPDPLEPLFVHPTERALPGEPLTEGFFKVSDTEQILSKTRATDADVEFIAEVTGDHHHEFKRPRLAECSQRLMKLNSTENNAGQTLLKHHPNVVEGSQTMIIPSDPGGPTTILRVNPSDLRELRTFQKISPNVIEKSRLPENQPSKPKITRIGRYIMPLEKYKEMLNSSNDPLRLQQNDPKGLKVLPTPHKAPQATSVPLIVVSEPKSPEIVTVNSEEIQFLDEEILVSDSRQENLLDKENQNVDNLDVAESEMDDEESDYRIGKNKPTNEDYIRDTESEINNTDDEDLDNDYRIDEEYLIYDDSTDETDENVSERGVGRRTRNAAKTSVKGPCEAMLRRLSAEAAVTLQPLTSLDIKKWTVDRKRRKED